MIRFYFGVFFFTCWLSDCTKKKEKEHQNKAVIGREPSVTASSPRQTLLILAEPTCLLATGTEAVLKGPGRHFSGHQAGEGEWKPGD